MKKAILIGVVAALAAMGCSTEPKPKSVEAYKKDFKKCKNNIEGIMKIMDRDMERKDLFRMKNVWIDNCMNEDMGWREPELKKVRENRRMLDGEWGFDHDSMQP